jgi:hypothetical protein
MLLLGSGVGLTLTRIRRKRSTIISLLLHMRHISCNRKSLKLADR